MYGATATASRSAAAARTSDLSEELIAACVLLQLKPALVELQPPPF
jgi:hypothetical protein